MSVLGRCRPLSTYTLSMTSEHDFGDAVTRVRAELAREGFSVLSEIDLQATLKEKLDVERDRYLILGACHAILAQQALRAEAELGVLLPCNVIVYEEQGETHIAAVDAKRMLAVVDDDELTATATAVRQRLAAVIERAAES